MTRTGIAATLALIVASGTAWADDQANTAKLFADPGVRQMTLATAQQSAVVMNEPCPGAQATVSTDVAVFQPLVFDAAGQLQTGIWRQQVTLAGCGATRTLNVIGWKQAGQAIGMGALLPGGTHTDVLLQRDAIQQVDQLVKITPGATEDGCAREYVADTRFVDREVPPTPGPTPGGKSPPWREVWTLRTCTKQIEVPIRFIPDATGTTITAGPQKAVVVTTLAK
ncbi:hypothetical protein UAJ10_17120 [Nitrospirillum sp. BR 11164]|uniref:hypothetical protein n=1 Tax=Nitrospirillum sp. BR 11164 TaxID=3104324 RepID=UPI002B003734|nr:hypothetical protein [Nitrospirillum sp. BR 11164]MEA1650730.1 hypothetical protein [Nitrospirillum sp. BR 11164]